jgi:hypothetical protein
MEMRYDGGSGIKDIGAMQIKIVADELFKSKFDLLEIQKNICEQKVLILSIQKYYSKIFDRCTKL